MSSEASQKFWPVHRPMFGWLVGWLAGWLSFWAYILKHGFPAMILPPDATLTFAMNFATRKSGLGHMVHARCIPSKYNHVSTSSFISKSSN